MKNDRAAEAVLACVVALLQRVRGLEQDQVLPMLQTAVGLLQLPLGSTTEEVRRVGGGELPLPDQQFSFAASVYAAPLGG